MQLHEYQQKLTTLAFGKRLPAAVYVYWDAVADFGEELSLLVVTLAARHGLGQEYNVIKFRTNELKVSFLSYPEFLATAHPALRHAVSIDLVTGRALRTDYAGNHNPPILHRKEAFLPANHPRHQEFAALTRAEEAAGLYEHSSTIGFKMNWERLLAEKGVKIQDHMLVSAGDIASKLQTTARGGRGNSINDEMAQVVVWRHKTALTRYELSKPVKTLLEYGMLKGEMTFFDYGCGQGSDVRGLLALGHHAEGWDPVHRADGKKLEADIVNIGYVLNVIEDPAERLDALVDAHRHARKLLVVSGLIRETVDTERARRFSDGVLTRANTFQKAYHHDGYRT